MDRDVNPKAQESLIAYRPAPVFRAEHGEDRLTRMVEMQSAKVPSEIFLLLSLGAMTYSLVAELMGKRRSSRFVGMWPGPLLMMGVYNKLVKTFGAR